MRNEKISLSNNATHVLSQALAEAAGRMDLSPTEVGRIVGLSQSAASRLLHGKFMLVEASKAAELAGLLIRLHAALFQLAGQDEELARLWLRSANRAFGGQLPCIVMRQAGGLLQACEYLEASLARA